MTDVARGKTVTDCAQRRLQLTARVCPPPLHDTQELCVVFGRRIRCGRLPAWLPDGACCHPADETGQRPAPRCFVCALEKLCSCLSRIAFCMCHIAFVLISATLNPLLTPPPPLIPTIWLLTVCLWPSSISRQLLLFRRMLLRSRRAVPFTATSSATRHCTASTRSTPRQWVRSMAQKCLTSSTTPLSSAPWGSSTSPKR